MSVSSSQVKGESIEEVGELEVDSEEISDEVGSEVVESRLGSELTIGDSELVLETGVLVGLEEVLIEELI